ncbi:MAG TPA: phospholipase A, partial [Cellvibrionaceae bacterium]
MNHSLLQKPLFVLALILCASAYSNESNDDGGTDDVTSTAHCLYWQLQKASPQTTVEELRAYCKPAAEISADKNAPAEDVLLQRRTMEKLGRANRFLLTPHNRNYLLPAVYTLDPYHAPFDDFDENDLQHTEVVFQLSMKVLLAQDLFHNKGNLYMAYTNHSFWQAYNGDKSRPFR